MNEFQKIETIKKAIGKSSSNVVVGIGDDAAVIKWKSSQMVITTDSQVENVHFSLKYSQAAELGHRLLAVNLSDLAAMGATPSAAVVSLGLTKSIDEKFLTEFYKGMGILARAHKMEIVGGNLSNSPLGLFLDLTAVGHVKGKPLTRAGVKPGNLLVLTGTVGDSAAGLAVLRRYGNDARKKYGKLVDHHLSPKPQVEFGKRIQPFATACVDVSDGLSSELHHLTEQSSASLVVDSETLPISAEVQALAAEWSRDSMDWALHGGEGYNLLFTIAPKDLKKVQAAAKATKTKVTVIGVAEKPAKESVWLRSEGDLYPLPPRGWLHF